MRALSVKQPWASALCMGFKDIENRSRQNHAIRGWVLIHATSPTNRYLNESLSSIRAMGGQGQQFLESIPQPLQCGQLVGAVKIGITVTESASPWFVGPFGYRIGDAVSFDPDPALSCTGALGFWKAGNQVRRRAFEHARALMIELRPDATWAI